MASPFTDQANSIETFIRSASPTTNFGSGTTFQVGTDAISLLNRSLIKWDLSSIPAGSVVISATLSIYVSFDNSDNTRTMRAYRVKRAWVEGQATWNIYSTGNNWGTAGCANTTTDREATDIGNVSVLSNLAVNAEVQISLTPSKVQEWISGALNNYGMLLKVDTETAQDQYIYYAHEHATAGTKPKLVITYTTPPVGGNPMFFSGGGVTVG